MFKFIPSMQTGVRQTFGKFSGLAKPGLALYIPYIQTISIVPNNLQFQSFKLRVKTKDNVFTDIAIGVQLQIKPEDTETAFFSLQNPNEQIATYVQNVVRSKVPQMRLDELFESQGDIAVSVRSTLQTTLGDVGYTIIDVLVNDISPARAVADAMNQINATERLKQAAQNEADALYIRQVRQAESEKMRKILSGEGISGQRLAILQGYQSGVETMAHALGISSRDIIDFVLETQRYDMMEHIGSSNNTKTIFLDTNKGTSKSTDTDAIRNGVLQANEA